MDASSSQPKRALPHPPASFNQRISFLDVDAGRRGSVSCWILGQQKTLWSVLIQSSRRHERREFCAIFLTQFDFGLTYNNEISSVRLGREPNFFMNLFTLAFQWFATSHTWKISCFFPREIQGIAKTYRFITVWSKFMCEQLPLFTEINYLASRQLWNLQTLKAPDTNSPWSSQRKLVMSSKWIWRSKSEIPKIPKGKRLIFVGIPNSAILVLKPMRVLGNLTIFP